MTKLSPQQVEILRKIGRVELHFFQGSDGRAARWVWSDGSRADGCRCAGMRHRYVPLIHIPQGSVLVKLTDARRSALAAAREWMP